MIHVFVLCLHRHETEQHTVMQVHKGNGLYHWGKTKAIHPKVPGYWYGQVTVYIKWKR